MKCNFLLISSLIGSDHLGIEAAPIWIFNMATVEFGLGLLTAFLALLDSIPLSLYLAGHPAFLPFILTMTKTSNNEKQWIKSICSFKNYGMGLWMYPNDALCLLELHAFGAEIHAQRFMSESGDWYIGSRDSCCAEYEIYTRSHHFIIPKPYQSEICDIFLHFWYDLFYFLVVYFLFLGLYFTLRYFRMTQSEKKLKLGQIF